VNCADVPAGQTEFECECPEKPWQMPKCEASGVISHLTPVALPPELNGVRVWFVDLKTGDNDLHRLKQLLDAEERERATRFATTYLSRRFVASHAALRVLLGGTLGIAPEAVRFCHGASGKPSLAGDCPASEVHFSLSHSGEAALIGIAEGRPLGIDLENVRDDLDFELLATQFLAHAELNWIASAPPESRRDAFYICWTAKEAWLKARGDGLSYSLNGFEVLPLSKSNVLRLKVYGHNVESTRWTLRRLSLPLGWIGALAVEAFPPGFKYRPINRSSERNLILSTCFPGDEQRQRSRRNFL
jgi:4'-phosphopantetheinyl transferase